MQYVGVGEGWTGHLCSPILTSYKGKHKIDNIRLINIVVDKQIEQHAQLSCNQIVDFTRYNYTVGVNVWT